MRALTGVLYLSVVTCLRWEIKDRGGHRSSEIASKMLYSSSFKSAGAFEHDDSVKRMRRVGMTKSMEGWAGMMNNMGGAGMIKRMGEGAGER